MRGSAVPILGACAILILTATTSHAKPRRVHSKGVTYVLELTTPGSTETEYVLFDPGREAWLSPATNARGKTCIRMGKGVQWTFIGDSRVTKGNGYAYFEAEPMNGRSFAEAAKAYQGRLAEMWDHEGVTFHRLLNVKEVGRFKIAGSFTKTVRLLQETTQRSNSWKTSPQTLLFECNGHLVSLTSRGHGDYLTPLIKGMRKVKPKVLEKPRTMHVIDSLGSPLTNIHFVLRTPAGYRTTQIPPELEDKAIVARWHRPKNCGDSPPGSLTLRRLTLDPSATVGDALASQIALWEEGGSESSAPEPLDLDGRTATELGFTHPVSEETPSGKAGWLVSWKSKHAVYALVFETPLPDDQDTSFLRTEALGMLKKFQTWESAPAR